jgi:predicted nucleic acid-binding protein
VPETISDTGPILHLGEIGRLDALSVVSPLRAPDLVWSELAARGIDHPSHQKAGIEVTIAPVEDSDWKTVIAGVSPTEIQPADAQVFALVQSSGFQALALTDDLALRKLIESHGATVVGSVGILIRAYSSGKLDRRQLDDAFQALFDKSTLHLSQAFRAYLVQLLRSL